MIRKGILLAVGLIITLVGSTSRSDWINLTGAENAPNIAEVTMLADRVRIVLEVYVGDLKHFELLVPDDWIKDAVERPPLEERLQAFSDDVLQVVTDSGEKLQADLVLVEPRLRKDRASPYSGMINPATRRQVQGPPEDRRVLYAELEYPFSGQPGSITIYPPADENDSALVSIGFIAYHKSVPVIDFRYLSQSVTLLLDWDDPWYTKFENPNLKRHHESALMSFLYIEPREVRHEVLIRVRDLESWLDLGLDRQTELNRAEQAEIKRKASEFFLQHNPVRVDGVLTKANSVRVEFLNISLSGLQILEDPEFVDLGTAIIGVILTYPVPNLPQEVTVLWELFSDRIDRLPATSIDPAGPFPGYVQSVDPEIKWQNFLRTYSEPEVVPVPSGHNVSVPVLTIVFFLVAIVAALIGLRARNRTPRVSWFALGISSLVAGIVFRGVFVDMPHPMPGNPDVETATNIVNNILSNASNAYIEKDADRFSQVLENVVGSRHFDDVQRELKRAFAIDVAGGGVALVETIENLSLDEVTDLEDAPGFRTTAEWTANARGGHWGHLHQRKIQYQAIADITDEDGQWKIDGITIVDARMLN